MNLSTLLLSLKIGTTLLERRKVKETISMLKAFLVSDSLVPLLGIHPQENLLPVFEQMALNGPSYSLISQMLIVPVSQMRIANSKRLTCTNSKLVTRLDQIFLDFNFVIIAHAENTWLSNFSVPSSCYIQY